MNSPTDGPLRLNIGSGETNIPGYTPVDRLYGQEAYPLAYPDNCADEVYASHVLEHFGRAEVEDVLADWVRVLKPGGRLRVAVPDADWIASAVVHGNREGADLEAFMYGGQKDGNDFHKSAHNERGLRLLFQRAGLVGVDRFTAEYSDSSSLPVSLNLAGYKPQDLKPWESRSTAILMSMPRLAFTDNMVSVLGAVQRCSSFIKSSGVFWGQCLERLMAQHIDKFEWFCVVDYDTVFRVCDLERLMVLFDAHPHADALAALQVKRECNEVLLNAGRDIPYQELDGPIFEVNTAHFGLTMIRTAALKKMPHPWFIAKPNEAGEWGENRLDEDIAFWHKFREYGNRVFVAPRVSVGHLEMVVSYVGEGFEPVYQRITDYDRDGPHPQARR